MNADQIVLAVLLVVITIALIKRARQRSRKIPVFEWPFDKKGRVNQSDLQKIRVKNQQGIFSLIFVFFCVLFLFSKDKVLDNDV